MSSRRVHPILIALPPAAFALTVVALVAHAATGDDAWYRGALFSGATGFVLALFATLAAVIDAANLPKFTVARAASLRQIAFGGLGLICFAATATAISNRYEGHHQPGDVIPLVIAAVGFVATAIAGWYGRVVVLAHGDNETMVWYPAHLLARMPSRPRPGSMRTIH